MQGVVVFGSVDVKARVEGVRNEFLRGMSTGRIFRVIGHIKYGVPRVRDDRMAKAGRGGLFVRISQAV